MNINICNQTKIPLLVCIVAYKHLCVIICNLHILFEIVCYYYGQAHIVHTRAKKCEGNAGNKKKSKLFLFSSHFAKKREYIYKICNTKLMLFRIFVINTHICYSLFHIFWFPSKKEEKKKKEWKKEQTKCILVHVQCACMWW